MENIVAVEMANAVDVAMENIVAVEMANAVDVAMENTVVVEMANVVLVAMESVVVVEASKLLLLKVESNSMMSSELTTKSREPKEQVVVVTEHVILNTDLLVKLVRKLIHTTAFPELVLEREM